MVNDKGMRYQDYLPHTPPSRCQLAAAVSILGGACAVALVSMPLLAASLSFYLTRIVVSFQ